MTISYETLQYQLGTTPVIQCGSSCSDTKLDTALFRSVAERKRGAVQ